VLSFEDVIYLINQDCTYCGDPPSRVQWAYHRTRTPKGLSTDEFKIVNGIDRVDSKLGYTKDNCAPCCDKCNTIKMDMTLDEFHGKVIKIYTNIIKNG
jgi:5-methylcytosine-specific restriction endonuclease McrA